eukprot:3016837-Rhodomonas_salina.2
MVPGDLAKFAADPTWKEHGGETYTVASYALTTPCPVLTWVVSYALDAMSVSYALPTPCPVLSRTCPPSLPLFASPPPAARSFSSACLTASITCSRLRERRKQGHVPYLPTRGPVLPGLYPYLPTRWLSIGPYPPQAMSGTDLERGPFRLHTHYAMPGTDLVLGRMGLRVCYGMCGTGLGGVRY